MIEIWGTICFMGAGGETFKSKDVVTSIVRTTGLAKKTAECYFSDFSIMARTNPNAFHGPASRLMRVGVGGGMYRLADNPQ